MLKLEDLVDLPDKTKESLWEKIQEGQSEVNEPD
jgi:hypothetical protein